MIRRASLPLLPMVVRSDDGGRLDPDSNETRRVRARRDALDDRVSRTDGSPRSPVVVGTKQPIALRPCVGDLGFSEVVCDAAHIAPRENALDAPARPTILGADDAVTRRSEQHDVHDEDPNWAGAGLPSAQPSRRRRASEKAPFPGPSLVAGAGFVHICPTDSRTASARCDRCRTTDLSPSKIGRPAERESSARPKRRAQAAAMVAVSDQEVPNDQHRRQAQTVVLAHEVDGHTRGGLRTRRAALVPDRRARARRPARHPRRRGRSGRRPGRPPDVRGVRERSRRRPVQGLRLPLLVRALGLRGAHARRARSPPGQLARERRGRSRAARDHNDAGVHRCRLLRLGHRPALRRRRHGARERADGGDVGADRDGVHGCDRLSPRAPRRHSRGLASRIPPLVGRAGADRGHRRRVHGHRCERSGYRRARRGLRRPLHRSRPHRS